MDGFIKDIEQRIVKKELNDSTPFLNKLQLLRLATPGKLNTSRRVFDHSS